MYHFPNFPTFMLHESVYWWLILKPIMYSFFLGAYVGILIGPNIGVTFLLKTNKLNKGEKRAGSMVIENKKEHHGKETNKMEIKHKKSESKKQVCT